MSRITTLPKGLQSLLGNTNFGDNPSRLGDTVIPTLSIEPFYAPDLLRLAQVSQTTTGDSITMVMLTVPSGKIALLRSWAVQASTLKDGSASVTIDGYPGSSNPPVVSTTRKIIRNVNTDSVGNEWAQLFPVVAGNRVDIRVADIEVEPTGTETQYTAHLFYYLLDV